MSDTMWLIYLVVASLWGYLASVRFPHQALKEGESLWYVMTIGVNTIVFPIGLLLRRFVYFIGVSNKIESNENGDVYEKGLSVVVESFARCDCEDCVAKRKADAENKD